MQCFHAEGFCQKVVKVWATDLYLLAPQRKFGSAAYLSHNYLPLFFLYLIT